MRVVEKIEAWGHGNITAENKTTFEITKKNHLTKKGNCIVGIRASKGAYGLSEEFKRLAMRMDARITVILRVDDLREVAKGRGNPQLTFKHSTDLVARKSSYICERTLMIMPDKAAVDFSKVLIQSIKKQNQKIDVTLIVEI